MTVLSRAAREWLDATEPRIPSRVYVVVAQFDFEGDELVGVFRDRERAEWVAAALDGHTGPYVWHVVHEEVIR